MHFYEALRPKYQYNIVLHRKFKAAFHNNKKIHVELITPFFGFLKVKIENKFLSDVGNHFYLYKISQEINIISLLSPTIQ